MLKYLYTKEVFSEVPGEISLGISISGCNIHCQGCHSRELWENKGTPLTIEELDSLIEKHNGITCVLLLGGEADIEALAMLFKHIYNKKIKTAWYCGLDMIPKDKLEIIQYLNYLKIGHYDSDLGGLTSPETNQRFYLIEHNNKDFTKTDLTDKFKKQTNEN